MCNISHLGGGGEEKKRKKRESCNFHAQMEKFLLRSVGWVGETSKLLRVEKTQEMVVLLKIDGAFILPMYLYTGYFAAITNFLSPTALSLKQKLLFELTVRNSLAV